MPDLFRHPPSRRLGIRDSNFVRAEARRTQRGSVTPLRPPRLCANHFSSTHVASIDIGYELAHIPMMRKVAHSEEREKLKPSMDDETQYLLRSPRNAERLLDAVRGFEAGDDKAVPFE